MQFLIKKVFLLKVKVIPEITEMTVKGSTRILKKALYSSENTRMRFPAYTLP
jgi:hypothetical protein